MQTNMNSESKTISCRLPDNVREQVLKIAKDEGVTPGKWLRKLVMQALHSPDDLPPQPVAVPSAAAISPVTLVKVIETKISEAEKRLHGDIESVTQSLAEVERRHHDALRSFAESFLRHFGRRTEPVDAPEVDLDAGLKSLILDAGAELLVAIERLKQSQRSHKDTLLQAIDGLTETKN
jgi:hypothetical protein